LEIRENIPLAPMTTFGIGGPARWFAEAASEADVEEACAWAQTRRTPLFVLGGGSNLLVSDAGFAGLVLRNAVKGIEQDGDVFRAGAGESWEHCVQRSTDAELAGIECLAGIPGTVGGTPVQNVGAYGQEVSSVIERVRVFDTQSRAFGELTAEECGFAYRKSRFNSTDRGQFIVTRVDYRLRKNGEANLSYLDLKIYFSYCAKEPTLVEVAEAVRRIRQDKGMVLVEGDSDCRSAGSFFKNPVVTEAVAEKIKAFAASASQPLRLYPADEGLLKVPAAWLIEQAGFKKGYARGAAGISSRHSLALTNRGGAKAQEILALASEIAGAVEAKFGVRLKMEPEKVGF
jgi:UDP-N-acetylmuramate dehydrogenase